MSAVLKPDEVGYPEPMGLSNADLQRALEHAADVARRCEPVRAIAVRLYEELANQQIARGVFIAYSQASSEVIR